MIPGKPVRLPTKVEKYEDCVDLVNYVKSYFPTCNNDESDDIFRYTINQIQK